MNPRPLLVVAAGSGALVLALAGVFGSWYTVDQGERAVVLRNGAIIGVAGPGFHTKMPIIDEVQPVSLRTQVWRATLPTYSRDQQPADLTVSVNWRAQEGEVAHVYADYGGLAGLHARLLEPRVPQAVKTVFGQFNAVTAIAERARLNLEVQEAVRAAVTGPVVVESVQLEDITFSDAYEQSVEQRMLAEVEVAKLRQNAEREKVQAEITVTKARAEADATRARAQAEADAVRVRGEAEAAAIRARGEALRDNPLLVDLVKAERWDGKLPATMVPGDSLPMLALP